MQPLTRQRAEQSRRNASHARRHRHPVTPCRSPAGARRGCWNRCGSGSERATTAIAPSGINRAKQREYVTVVLNREEMAAVLGRLSGREWYVFPASHRSRDPITGRIKRDHIDASVMHVLQRGGGAVRRPADALLGGMGAAPLRVNLQAGGAGERQSTGFGVVGPPARGWRRAVQGRCRGEADGSDGGPCRRAAVSGHACEGLDHDSDHHVTSATGRRASAPAPTLERGSQSARVRPVRGPPVRHKVRAGRSDPRAPAPIVARWVSVGARRG